MVKKRGIVWNYFTKKIHGSQITAFCKFCDQSYIQNATRMEKHIERCVKCPEDVKRSFMNAIKNKRAKSIITMKLAENWSINDPRTLQNEASNGTLTEWGYGNEYNIQVSNSVTNDSEVTDSKSWNTNSQTENTQLEEPIENREWESANENETEPLIEDAIQEQSEESSFIRRNHINKKFSQSSSSRTSVSTILQNRIQQEQYMERRALRRLAELELQRKTLEFERFEWEYQKDKSQSEVRWAHECRMMQLKEEQQQQILEQNRNKAIASKKNIM